MLNLFVLTAYIMAHLTWCKKEASDLTQIPSDRAALMSMILYLQSHIIA